MATLPAIGSTRFRCLSYKQQLEIVSLQLFDPDEYERQTGAKAKGPKQESLIFPPLPEVDLPDLPVSFLDNYWAGYSARYRAKWYGLNSPLLDHGVEEQRMVNICTFNFPLIVLTPAIFYISEWLRRCYFTSFSILSLTHACKVLVYLDQVLRGREAHYLFSEWDEIKKKATYIGEGATKLYIRALDTLDGVVSLSQINELQETVQDNKSLLSRLQHQTLVVHPQARSLWGRWLYPLVPSALYCDGRFHIYNWNWLQDRHKFDH